MKKIFIAATKQNDGKTTVSLGLISALKKRFSKIGFIKPIGQRYLEEEGLKVDEDSVLIEKVCGIKCGLKDMSPIAVERGFTEEYILRPDKNSLTEQIKESFSRVAKDKDLVIIEGTGHAGVGSVFDHSNAFVAKLLEAKVLLISSGGIGRPIDEIMLNLALFQKEGVELIGAVINKVHPEKYDKVNRLVRLGLSRKGIEVLGVLPYEPILTAPTISQILEETDFQLLSGEKSLDNSVKKILVGAMEPHEALNYIEEGCLIITPGDREDIILTAMSFHLAGVKAGIKISGIVLSGGIVPHKTIMDLTLKTDLPVLLAKDDTYSVATCIHDLIVKIRPQDTQKVNAAIKLVEDYVDIKRILERI